MMPALQTRMSTWRRSALIACANLWTEASDAKSSSRTSTFPSPVAIDCSIACTTIFHTSQQHHVQFNSLGHKGELYRAFSPFMSQEDTNAWPGMHMRSAKGLYSEQ